MSTKKQIKDFPGYFIDTDGILWTGKRRGSKSHQHPLRQKAVWTTNTTGHKSVYLYRDGQRFHHFVHRLVLETFVRPARENEVAMHINNVPDDNRVVNLKWGTHKENMIDYHKRATLERAELSLKAAFYDYAERVHPEIVEQFQRLAV